MKKININKLLANVKQKRGNKFKFLFLTLFFKTIINFLLLFYVAKISSIEDFGAFSFAFVIMTIGVLLIDYGYNLHALVIEDENENLSLKVSSILSGKGIILISLLILFVPFLFYLELKPDYNLVLIILALASIPNSFGNFYYALFKAEEKYQIETKGFVVQGLLLTILLIINHFFGSLDIVTIAILVLITKIVYFIIAYYYFKKFFRVNIGFSYRKGLFSLRRSLSFGTHVVLGTLILYIDTLILTYLTDMKAVGYYQSSIRIIMAASLFGTIITDGFVPEISRRVLDIKYITKRMSDLYVFLLVFYLLLLCSLAFYYDSIINLLYSEKYLFISQYMIYVLLIILFRAIGIVPGVILTSLGLQRIRANTVAVSCFISLGLNLTLIPIFDLEGAFMSFLLTNIFLNTTYFIYAIRKLTFVRIPKLPIIAVLLGYVIFHVIFVEDNYIYLVISLLISALILFWTIRKIQTDRAYVAN